MYNNTQNDKYTYKQSQKQTLFIKYTHKDIKKQK